MKSCEKPVVIKSDKGGEWPPEEINTLVQEEPVSGRSEADLSHRGPPRTESR